MNNDSLPKINQSRTLILGIKSVIILSLDYLEAVKWLFK